MIDWKISIGGILAVLLSVLLGHRLATNRESDAQYRTRVAEFRELLVPFLRALESEDAHPTMLVSQHFPEHDEAARKLMVYMPRRKKTRFATKWRQYELLYQEKQSQGIFGLIATEVDDLERASPGTPGAEEYLYEQTAKRSNEVRRVIQAALNVL